MISKTTTLTDALARATKGPVTVITDRDTVYIDLGPGMPAFGCTGWVKSVAEPNAALLAHCFNTLPGLVEAVNAIRDTLWCDHETGTCNMCQLREALRAAQEVKL